MFTVVCLETLAVDMGCGMDVHGCAWRMPAIDREYGTVFHGRALRIPVLWHGNVEWTFTVVRSVHRGLTWKRKMDDHSRLRRKPDVNVELSTGCLRSCVGNAGLVTWKC